MSRRLRFSVVGTGVGGGFISGAAMTLAKEGLLELAGVVARNPSKTEAFAKKYGFRSAYTDLNEMLRVEKPDILAVSVPHYMHFPIALEAIENSVNVLVDKPMCINLWEADELIRRAERKGVKLGVILQSRFSDTYRFVKGLADKGGLGKLILGEAVVEWYRTQEYYAKSGWRGRWATEGGGALINQAIHTIDLLQWIMGPVDFLYGICDTRTHHIEVEDLAVSILRFRSGALGYIVGSVSIKPQETCLNIYGSEGAVCVRDGRVTVWTVKDVKPPSGEEMKTSLTGHNAVVEDFLSAIVEDREPMVTGEEGRKSLEIVLAIYRASMKEGKVVFPLAE